MGKAASGGAFSAAAPAYAPLVCIVFMGHRICIKSRSCDQHSVPDVVVQDCGAWVRLVYVLSKHVNSVRYGDFITSVALSGVCYVSS